MFSRRADDSLPVAGASRVAGPQRAVRRGGVRPVGDRVRDPAARLAQPCEAGLPWSCFVHLDPGAVLAVQALTAAAANSEAGIHIMLVGPPGTGKTEFARALAARASLGLYAAGEAGENDSEPSRAARGAALRLSLALLARRRDAAVLLDEAEDVLDGTRSFGARREAVSKVFLNRMLERAPPATRPIGWTRRRCGA